MNETKEMDELERRSRVKEIGGGNRQKRRGKKGAWARKGKVKKFRESEISLEVRSEMFLQKQ